MLTDWLKPFGIRIMFGKQGKYEDVGLKYVLNVRIVLNDTTFGTIRFLSRNSKCRYWGQFRWVG